MNDIVFTAQKINKLTLKNRVIMTAMHLGYEFEKEKQFYSQCAEGGVAAITTVMGVIPFGAYSNMLCASEKTGEKLLELSKTIHSFDSKLFVQLFCAGRNGRKGIMAEPELEPLAPSSIPSKIYKCVPKAMTEVDIQDTISAFGNSAKLCKENGVDAVEISCSAGYLLSQFLSPITNKRQDKYGGDAKKRMKFPLEVINKVREAVGDDFPIILRISGGDMIGGYDIDYMKELIKEIPKGQIDAVNVTGGWHESSIPQIDMHLPKGGFAYLANQIKQITDLPIIACNRINDGETIQNILSKEMADFVGCARAHLADPNFVNKIKNNIPYRKCIACNKGCIENILKMNEVQCVMNPVNDLRDLLKNNSEKRKLLVIGAGPAGLESGKFLALKGNDVTICTDQGEVGGLVNLAAIPPGKQDMGALIDSLLYDLKKLNVKIKLSTLIDEDYLKNNRFDKIIVATGSLPIDIHLGKENVYTADEILSQKFDGKPEKNYGSIAIVGGGLVGVETAKFIASKDGFAKITILEMMDTIGKEYRSTRFLEINDLKEKNICMITGAQVTLYKDGILYYKNDDGTSKIKADSVVMALGNF